jgi:hypothetical protein
LSFFVLVSVFSTDILTGDGSVPRYPLVESHKNLGFDDGADVRGEALKAYQACLPDDLKIK